MTRKCLHFSMSCRPRDSDPAYEQTLESPSENESGIYSNFKEQFQIFDRFDDLKTFFHNFSLLI